MKRVTLAVVGAIFLMPVFSSFAGVVIANNAINNGLIWLYNGDELLVDGNFSSDIVVSSYFGQRAKITINTNADSNGNFTYGIDKRLKNPNEWLEGAAAISMNTNALSSFSEINIINGRIIGESNLSALISIHNPSFQPTEINIGANGSVISTNQAAPAIYVRTNGTTTINNSGQITGEIYSKANNKIPIPVDEMKIAGEKNNKLIINNNAGGNIDGDIKLNDSIGSTINNNGGQINGNISGGHISQVINFNAANSNIVGDVSFIGTINVNEDAQISGTIDGKSLGVINLNGKSLSFGALKDVNIVATSNSSININSASSISQANIDLAGNNNTQAVELNFLESLDANNRGQISGNFSSKVNFSKASAFGQNLMIGKANSPIGIVEFNNLGTNAKQAYNFSNNNAQIYANNVDFDGGAILNITNAVIFDAQTKIREGAEIRFTENNASFNSSDGFILEGNALISTAVNAENGLAGNIKTVGAAIIADGAKLNFTISSNSDNQEINSYIGKEFVIVEGNENSQIAAIAAENLMANNAIQQDIASNRYKSLVASTFVKNNQLILTFADQKYLIAANQSNENIYDSIYASQSSSGDLYNLRQFLDSYNSDAAKKSALDSTAPQSDNAIHRVSFDNSLQIADIISQHLNHSKNSWNKNLWIEIFNNNSKQQNKSESAGYKNNSSGLIIGLDKEINYNVLVGASLGFAESRINSNDNLKNTDIKSFQGNIYSRYNFRQKFFINSNLGFSFNEYNTKRSIPLTQKRANSIHNGQTYFGQIQFGLNQNLQNDYSVMPFLSLSAAKNSVDSYTEKNADELNLRVKEKAANLLELRLGGELKKDYLSNFGLKISPKISLSIARDFIGDEQKTSSNFIGENFSFETSGARISQNSARATIGVNIFQANKLSFDANYIFERRSGYSVNGAQVKGSYSF